MEETILEGYHESIIRTLFHKNNFRFQYWESLYRDVLEVFDKKTNDLEMVLKNYVYHQTEEPLKDILEFLINSFIQENHPSELWKHAVEIKTSYSDTPYDTKTRYNIVVYPKETIISLMSPLWVFEHHQEVFEFMSGDNEFYNRIYKLAGKYVEI